MIAYKFLRVGGVGPFSGFAWPRPDGGPGAWVVAGEDLVICHRAVHACAVEDLVLWLDDELWLVELTDVVDTGNGKVAARSGRLLEQVEAWTEGLAIEFAGACASRAAECAAQLVADPQRRERLEAMAADAAAYATGAAGDPQRPAARSATAAFIAAEAAAQAAARTDAAREERIWQSAWLAERLALTQM